MSTLKLIKINKWVLLSTVFSMFLCFGLVEYFGAYGANIEGWFATPLIIGIFLVPGILITTVVLSILKSIKGESKTYQLETIGLSYFCLILCFSSVYYLQAAIGDFNETVAEKNYYEMLKHPTFQGDIKNGYDLRRGESARAFKGIEQRMFGSVGDKVVFWPSGSVEPPLEKLVEASRWSVADIAYFKRVSRIPIFVDCLYFSIATITTLGFGDITPVSIISKLTTSLEVLAGLLLAVVAIGLAIQRQSEP